MKARIEFIPAEFYATGYTIAIPYDAIYSQIHEAKNTTELQSLVETLKAPRMDKPAIVSITPLTRKVNGFDKWETANRRILEVRAA